LGFIRKLTLSPSDVGPEDVRTVTDEGVGEEALIDAVVTCFHFNLIDRVADSLGFDLRTEDEYEVAAGFLLKYGYAFPAPLRLLARDPKW